MNAQPAAAVRSNWFVRNVMSGIGASALGAVVQLVVVTMLAALVPQVLFAAFITANAVVGVLENASHFGTATWAIRSFAAASKVGENFWLVVRTKGFYSLCVLLVLLCAPLQNLSWTAVLLSFLVAITQAGSDPFLWYLIGRERLDLESLSYMLGRLGNMTFLLLAAYWGFPIEVLLGVWLLGNLLRILGETRFPLVRELLRVPHEAIPWSRVLDVARIAFPIGLATAVYAGYQRLGVFALQSLADSVQVANFGAAFSLVIPLGFIAATIARAYFPSLAAAVIQDRRQDAERIVSKQLILIAAIFIPITIVGTLLAPWIVSVLYGATYRPAVPVMVILLPGLYISNLTWVMQQTCNAAGLNWESLSTLVIGMVVFFVIMLSRIAPVDATLAALAWTTGESVSFLSRWAVLSRRRHLSYSRGLIWVALFLGTIGTQYLIYPSSVAFYQAYASVVTAVLH